MKLRKNHDEMYRNIGANIRHYRKENGFTQEKLAQRINISKSYLSKIEAQNCIKSFSVEVLLDIAEALGIPPYVLFQ